MDEATSDRSRCILVEVSAGELIDKITVLEVKMARITDPEKLTNINSELQVLAAARERGLDSSTRLDELSIRLRLVNAELFDVIAEIYQCERRNDHGARFVSLARDVYRLNDQRALLKREINHLTGSRLIEEKDHPLPMAVGG